MGIGGIMSRVFETLNSVNVNEFTEKKEGLTYLTWSKAWEEVKKRFPGASYTIWKNENGLPYTYDPLTGYMVYTSVTIEDVTHEMWLPVMDSKNRPMKSEPYEYTTKYGTKTVAAATMFDVNKAIMRCLTKNLAMFGLGLYIYNGEDLPQSEDSTPQPKPFDVVEYTKKKTQLMKYINTHDYTEEQIQQICKAYKVNDLADLQLEQINHYLEQLKAHGKEIED